MRRGPPGRKPHACPVCDVTSFSSLLRTDIPAHFTVTLAGEEWRAHGAGVQRLPGAAEEAEHSPCPPAPLQ